MHGFDVLTALTTTQQRTVFPPHPATSFSSRCIQGSLIHQTTNPCVPSPCAVDPRPLAQADPGLCTPELLAGLPELSEAAELLASNRASFQPDYGCLLLALPPAAAPAGAAGGGEESLLLPGPVVVVGELYLHLVCLDGWDFGVHRWGKQHRWDTHLCLMGICRQLQADASMSPLRLPHGKFPPAIATELTYISTYTSTISPRAHHVALRLNHAAPWAIPLTPRRLTDTPLRLWAPLRPQILNR
jgi:hypothetical protein